VDYIVGERWNVIADIVPAKGHRIQMDTFPGFIHSGDDFVQNSAGILYTETTIGGFKGFDEKGTQSSAGAQSCTVRKLHRRLHPNHEDRNNGGYANDWLIGDTKTNEIAQARAGPQERKALAQQRMGSSLDATFPATTSCCRGDELRPGEQPDLQQRRKLRWEQVSVESKGKIDAEAAKRFMADHFDEANLCMGACVRTLCGHGELDPTGIPEAGWMRTRR